MSRLILSVSLLALIACGCDDNGNSQSISQTSTQAKPIVSIVPVIDNTKNDVDWNLSDELSSMLYSRIAQKNHLHLVDSSHVRAKTKKLSDKNNPFGADITWTKQSFQGDDFVVFLELIEHEEVLNQNKRSPTDPSNCSANINISMRVRVLDVRGEEPRVILQELVHNSHSVARQFTQINFFQVPWGDPSYSISPMGLAHEEFTKEVSSRIEDYILTMSKK